MTTSNIGRIAQGASGTSRAPLVDYLLQLLADTVTLRDMYISLRRQASDSVSRQRHLLFDRHFSGQHVLVDHIAQRVQTLGGIPAAAVENVAARTLIPCVSGGLEAPSRHVCRLLQAHEIILVVSRATAQAMAELGIDEPTVSEVVGTNEAHVLSLFMHVVRDQTVFGESTCYVGDHASPERSFA